MLLFTIMELHVSYARLHHCMGHLSKLAGYKLDDPREGERIIAVYKLQKSS